MLFERIYDEDLAQASYLSGCQATGQAAVMDPRRDVQVYLDRAGEEDLEIVAVTETHIHADYLSGSRELAAAAGATRRCTSRTRGTRTGSTGSRARGSTTVAR
jgi:hydroxyacylglutathione hydrolase